MSNNQTKLSVEPYKGTRDFYPRDQFVQNYIFSVWRKACQAFGYLEYGASILEETELYKSKSGEEIVNEQTYSFIDRGGRNVTIRPEMTPTVARMVAQKRKELSFPLRWFSIPNLFRYERPQRGRLREHWQLNADLFGVDGIEADAEIINLAYQIMKGFGAKDDDFEIRINNRKLANALRMNNFFNLTLAEAHKIARLTDKKNKMGDSEFSDGLKQIFHNEGKVSAYIAILQMKGVDTAAQTIADGISKLSEMSEKLSEEDNARINEGIRELDVLEKSLLNKDIKNWIFDNSLERGFDYYTGTVFEVYDNNPKNPRALFGGGRYDDLVGIFGVEKVPGVGFGMGDVTIRDFLETHNLLPEYRPPVDLYICHLEGYLDAANKLASELRQEGARAAVDLTERKVSQQVKTADKEQIPYVIVVGEEEVKKGIYKLKNLKSSKETELYKGDIASHLWKEDRV